jgi:hypothetical protein
MTPVSPTLAEQIAYCRARYHSRCFSIEETSKILGVSTDKVLELERRGVLYGHRPDVGAGAALRFSAGAIDRYFTRRRR